MRGSSAWKIARGASRRTEAFTVGSSAVFP
jgi:hypothetical protein